MSDNSLIPTMAQHYASLPYQTVMHYEADDDHVCYIAENPELPGCIAQGATQEEAQDNLKDARYEYILSLLEDGLMVPQPSLPVKVVGPYEEMIQGFMFAPVEVSVHSAGIPEMYQNTAGLVACH